MNIQVYHGNVPEVNVCEYGCLNPQNILMRYGHVILDCNYAIYPYSNNSLIMVFIAIPKNVIWFIALNHKKHDSSSASMQTKHCTVHCPH